MTSQGPGSARALPSGTVTFVFSDVEGSTGLFRRLGDRYRPLLTEYRRIVGAAVADHGGVEVESEGDGLFLAFGDAVEALRACTDAQREMGSHDWPPDASLRARIGLHTGVATPTPEGGYVALAVHLAARVAAAAQGGQVLVSEQTATVLRDDLPEAMALIDRGAFQLRGFDQPQRIFQLAHPDLDGALTPLRASAAKTDNLPQQLSSFVGRAEEIDDVGQLVEHHRLVTLTGPGGIGKTRLALQTAEELLDGSGEGVWLVELAALTDPDAVPGAVGAVLNIKEQPGRSGMDTLVEALADLYLLIVLDNCEHLIDACAQLAEAVLRHCPRVHLLATSREALGIEGERVVRVRSLSLPPPEAKDLDDLAGSDAAALFLERVRADSSGMALSDDAAPLIGGICRRLDGLPLAIELAAARLRSMSLLDIHDRLDQRFRLLSGGRRTAVPRQQTLAATIAWSYDLLDGFEQSVFRRLSVFPADFDLEAAEAFDLVAGSETMDIADTIDRLVDKSLLVADTSGDSGRYRMLESIRDYAFTRLAKDDQVDLQVLRDAHAHYYSDLLVRAASELRGPSQRSWLARIDQEYANLRAAFEHLLTGPKGARQVMRLFGDSRSYWWVVASHDSEAIALLDRCFDLAPDESPPATRAAALLCKAYLLYSSDLGGQESCADAALELARDAGERALEAEALGLVCYNSGFRGTPERSIEAGGKAVAMARDLQDPVLLGQTLVFSAAPLKGIASDQAEAAYREALGLVAKSGDLCTEILAHGDFADFLLFEERIEEAHEQVDHVLRLASFAGSRTRDVARGNLGWVLLSEGDPATGTQQFTALLHDAHRRGDLSMLAFATMGLAACATEAGDFERAATLHGASDALSMVLGNDELQSTDRKYCDRSIAVLRTELGDDFERCYKRGGSMSRSQAVGYALGR